MRAEIQSSDATVAQMTIHAIARGSAVPCPGVAHFALERGLLMLLSNANRLASSRHRGFESLEARYLQSGSLTLGVGLTTDEFMPDGMPDFTLNVDANFASSSSSSGGMTSASLTLDGGGGLSGAYTFGYFFDSNPSAYESQYFSVDMTGNTDGTYDLNLNWNFARSDGPIGAGIGLSISEDNVVGDLSLTIHDDFVLNGHDAEADFSVTAHFDQANNESSVIIGAEIKW